MTADCLVAVLRHSMSVDEEEMLNLISKDMEKVYIVTLDEVSDTIGVNQCLYAFKAYDDAKKNMDSMVESFKESLPEWDNTEDYECEQTDESFEWWEEGCYLENRYVVKLQEYKLM